MTGRCTYRILTPLFLGVKTEMLTRGRQSSCCMSEPSSSLAKDLLTQRFLARESINPRQNSCIEGLLPFSLEVEDL